MPRMVPLADLAVHPDAATVPEMPREEWVFFLADVAARGVRVPVEVIPGTLTIIDGRTRWKAAWEAGEAVIPVVDAPLADGEDPVTYMLRAALTRRHLTSSQRAALAVEIEARVSEQAKERQRAAGGDKRAAPKPPGPVEEIVPQAPRRPQARDEAAAAAGTNGKYVSDAKRLKAEAPALLERVKAGELTIPAAKAELRKTAAPAEAKPAGDADDSAPAGLTAHQLARMLRDGPDVPVVLCPDGRPAAEVVRRAGAVVIG